VFRVGAERFAVELRAVHEIVDAPAVTPLPDAEYPLAGAISVRGRAIPLYSAASVLGVSLERSGVALIMNWGERRLAFAADDADEIVSVELGDIRNPPYSGHDDEVVAGVLWRGAELVTVLDARALLNVFAGTLAQEAL
jgi:purine-binding chemotaxis protein CheW